MFSGQTFLGSETEKCIPVIAANPPLIEPSTPKPEMSIPVLGNGEDRIAGQPVPKSEAGELQIRLRKP